MSQRVTREEEDGARAATAALLREVAAAAVAAVSGEALVADALAGGDLVVGASDPVWLAGAGKAVGAMAAGARRALGPRVRDGVFIGKHPAPGVTVAGHPLPDERGAAATRELLRFVGGLGEGDTLLLLLSGGASALLAEPRPGLRVADLAAATATLLASGEPIDRINTVRRRLGAALGGRLASATRARVVTLALSDVIGDDPAAIGSGPVTPDPTTAADALAVAEHARLPSEVRDFLAREARAEQAGAPAHRSTETPRVTFRILATPSTLRDAAVRALLARGRAAFVEEGLVAGSVERLAERYAHLARALPPSTVQVAVGEPTVRLPASPGRGGRAQQLALLVARQLAGTASVFLAVGSDGSDGPTDAAGALVDGATWARALAAGLDPERALAGADAAPLLDALGALVRTGPTGTNLLDLHLLTSAMPP